MKLRTTIIGLAVVVAGAAALLSLDSGTGEESLYLNTAVVAEGKTLYAEHCASCHGVDLTGEPNWKDRDADGLLPAPPHDETGHTWHHPTEQLFEITKHGTAAVVGNGYRSNMAGFGDVLSDGQIQAILAYIKSTWPAPVIEQHNRIEAAN